jgi:hypothetical protein
MQHGRLVVGVRHNVPADHVRHTIGNTNIYANGDVDPDRDKYSDINADQYSDVYAYKYGNTDPYTDVDADKHGNGNADKYSDSDCDGNTYADEHADEYSDQYSYGDGDGYLDEHADGNSDFDTAHSVVTSRELTLTVTAGPTCRFTGRLRATGITRDRPQVLWDFTSEPLKTFLHRVILTTTAGPTSLFTVRRTGSGTG